MADKTGEQLSALVDGECEAQELQLALRRLAKDKDLKARWRRYHLLSDALKNNLPELIDANFSERVRKAIDAESPLQNTRLYSASSFYKPVAGFALAASVAIAALFLVRTMDLHEGSTSHLLAAADSSKQQPPEQQVIKPVVADNALENRLNSYLVNHNEYASMNSVHGMLPYVRMVGYEPSGR